MKPFLHRLLRAGGRDIPREDEAPVALPSVIETLTPDPVIEPETGPEPEAVSDHDSVPDFETLDFASRLEHLEGMISVEEAEFLRELARTVEEGCIVEVGSYRGRSSVALGTGSLEGAGAAVYAIEPHEEFVGVLGASFGPEDRAGFYRAMLMSGCYRAVRLVNLSSEQVTPGWTRPVGLLWIDGDHTWEGVSRDYRCWARHLAPGALVAFHDSTDPNIGPYRLIRVLVEAGEADVVQVVDRITVIRPQIASATARQSA